MRDTPTRRRLAILLAFSFACCFLNLGGFSLTSMEPMVIDGARHMLTHGQWAVPHLYGEMFMFKPPLAPWMSALPLALWEQPSELMLRLPYALAGTFLGLALFGLFTWVGSSRLGLITALAVIATVQFVEKVRIAQYEIPLAAGVGIAVAAAAINLSRPRDRVGLWLLAYVGLGIGFLAKGMPALMAFAPGVLGAALLTGSVRRLFRWRHLCGWALGALMIGGYLSWAHETAGPGAFLQAAAEARARAIGWDALSFSKTLAKPVVIWVCFLPWSFALFLWPRFRDIATPDQRTMANAALGFVLGGVLAFVIVPTYEPRYYLPLVTSFAMLSGVILEALHDRQIDRRLLVGGRSLFIVALLALTAAGLSRGAASWPVLIAVFSLAAVAAFRRSRSLYTAGGLVRVLAATALVCAVGQALVTIPGRAAKRDQATVARDLRPHLPRDETLWVLGPADCAARVGSLLYYLDRPIRTLAHPRIAEAGSTVLLVEPQSSRLPDDFDYEVIGRVSHPRLKLTVIRAGLESGERWYLEGPASGYEGARIGDLCGARYRQPVAEDSAAELDYNLRIPDAERPFYVTAGGS